MLMKSHRVISIEILIEVSRVNKMRKKSVRTEPKECLALGINRGHITKEDRGSGQRDKRTGSVHYQRSQGR